MDSKISNDLSQKPSMDLRNFRGSFFCKIVSSILIVTFLVMDIAWADPGRNLATTPMTQPLNKADIDITMVKVFVQTCLEEKEFSSINKEVEMPMADGKVVAFFNSKRQENGRFIIPVNFHGRAYDVTIDRNGGVLDAERKSGKFDIVNMNAFKTAVSLGLNELPVISDKDPLMKFYKKEVGDSLPAVVVAQSSDKVFPGEVIEYAKKNPKCEFILKEEGFFRDPEKVSAYINDLKRKEATKLQTAVVEKEEKLLSEAVTESPAESAADVSKSFPQRFSENLAKVLGHVKKGLIAFKNKTSFKDSSVRLNSHPMVGVAVMMYLLWDTVGTLLRVDTLGTLIGVVLLCAAGVVGLGLTVVFAQPIIGMVKERAWARLSGAILCFLFTSKICALIALNVAAYNMPRVFSSDKLTAEEESSNLQGLVGKGLLGKRVVCYYQRVKVGSDNHDFVLDDRDSESFLSGNIFRRLSRVENITDKWYYDIEYSERGTSYKQIKKIVKKVLFTGVEIGSLTYTYGDKSDGISRDVWVEWDHLGRKLAIYSNRDIMDWQEEPIEVFKYYGMTKKVRFHGIKQDLNEWEVSEYNKNGELKSKKMEKRARMRSVWFSPQAVKSKKSGSIVSPQLQTATSRRAVTVAEKRDRAYKQLSGNIPRSFISHRLYSHPLVSLMALLTTVSVFGQDTSLLSIGVAFVLATWAGVVILRKATDLFGKKNVLTGALSLLLGIMPFVAVLPGCGGDETGIGPNMTPVATAGVGVPTIEPYSKEKVYVYDDLGRLMVVYKNTYAQKIEKPLERYSYYRDTKRIERKTVYSSQDLSDVEYFRKFGEVVYYDEEFYPDGSARKKEEGVYNAGLLKVYAWTYYGGTDKKLIETVDWNDFQNAVWAESTFGIDGKLVKVHYGDKYDNIDCSFGFEHDMTTGRMIGRDERGRLALIYDDQAMFEKYVGSRYREMYRYYGDTGKIETKTVCTEKNVDEQAYGFNFITYTYFDEEFYPDGSARIWKKWTVHQQFVTSTTWEYHPGTDKKHIEIIEDLYHSFKDEYEFDMDGKLKRHKGFKDGAMNMDYHFEHDISTGYMTVFDDNGRKIGVCDSPKAWEKEYRFREFYSYYGSGNLKFDVKFTQDENYQHFFVRNVYMDEGNGKGRVKERHMNAGVVDVYGEEECKWEVKRYEYYEGTDKVHLETTEKDTKKRTISKYDMDGVLKKESVQDMTEKEVRNAKLAVLDWWRLSGESVQGNNEKQAPNSINEFQEAPLPYSMRDGRSNLISGAIKDKMAKSGNMIAYSITILPLYLYANAIGQDTSLLSIGVAVVLATWAGVVILRKATDLFGKKNVLTGALSLLLGIMPFIAMLPGCGGGGTGGVVPDVSTPTATVSPVETSTSGPTGSATAEPSKTVTAQVSPTSMPTVFFTSTPYPTSTRIPTATATSTTGPSLPTPMPIVPVTQPPEVYQDINGKWHKDSEFCIVGGIYKAQRSDMYNDKACTDYHGSEIFRFYNSSRILGKWIYDKGGSFLEQYTYYDTDGNRMKRKDLAQKDSNGNIAYEHYDENWNGQGYGRLKFSFKSKNQVDSKGLNAFLYVYYPNTDKVDKKVGYLEKDIDDMLNDDVNWAVENHWAGYYQYKNDANNSYDKYVRNFHYQARKDRPYVAYSLYTHPATVLAAAYAASSMTELDTSVVSLGVAVLLIGGAMVMGMAMLKKEAAKHGSLANMAEYYGHMMTAAVFNAGRALSETFEYFIHMLNTAIHNAVRQPGLATNEGYWVSGETQPTDHPTVMMMAGRAHDRGKYLRDKVKQTRDRTRSAKLKEKSEQLKAASHEPRATSDESPVPADLSGLPEDLCGIFLNEKGEVSHYVAWSDMREEFVLKSVIADDNFKRITGNYKNYHSVMKEGLVLDKEDRTGEETGTMVFFRFSKVEVDNKLVSKYSIIPEVDHMTLETMSLVRGIAKDIRKGAAPEKLVTRSVAINADLFAGVINDEEMVKTILDIIAQKEKSINQVFGREMIRVEFSSIAGDQKLETAVAEKYAEVAKDHKKGIKRSGDTVEEGYIITDMNANVKEGSYVLPMTGGFEAKDGADLYNIAGILDLAAGLTLLINTNDKEEYKPRIEGLYKQLLGKGFEEKGMDIGVLFEKYKREFLEKFVSLAIPPVAKLNYEELKGMYKRIREVLTRA